MRHDTLPRFFAMLPPAPPPAVIEAETPPALSPPEDMLPPLWRCCAGAQERHRTPRQPMIRYAPPHGARQLRRSRVYGAPRQVLCRRLSQRYENTHATRVMRLLIVEHTAATLMSSAPLIDDGVFIAANNMSRHMRLQPRYEERRAPPSLLSVTLSTRVAYDVYGAHIAHMVRRYDIASL